jgi:DNA-binding PadR family transcriptional regulator
MRLTYPTATVLRALAHGHTYGFEIIDATGLRAGTVYPILRRLDEGGFVRSSWESAGTARADGRPPRRTYRMTGEGERAAREALERYPALSRLFDAGTGEETAPA